MVSLEFEKPSTWSIGKKIGALAAVILFIGGFLSFNICFPLLTIVLIVILLYMKFDIYMEKEKDMTRLRINHFILIAWSALYFGIFLLQAIFWAVIISRFESNYYSIMGIGLWLTTFGFLLCIIAGLLEWRYPTKEAALKILGKKKEKEVVPEVAPEPSTEAVAPVEVKKPISVVKAEEIPKAAPVVEPEPIPVSAPAKAEKIEVVSREPSSEEEKTLLRWARHIAGDGKTFEQCMKCGKYVFLSAKDSGDNIVFKCPECGESFTLNK